jgi:hypothetical protein
VLEFVRKAYRELIDLVVGVDEKLDVLISEVRVRNAQHDHLSAQINYLIILEKENRLKREEQEQKERMSIVLPMLDETM